VVRTRAAGRPWCPLVDGLPAYLGSMSATRIEAVGAVVRDDRERLLLIRRGREPGLGRWSLPGGRVEPGEDARHAVVREVEEETGLRIVVTGLAGYVERPGPDAVVFEIEDYYARVEPGSDPHVLVPGDDAVDAGWFPPHRLVGLDLVDGLLDVLTEWGVLPLLPHQQR
jgi:8-oxo-dGTP diphosphatase